MIDKNFSEIPDLNQALRYTEQYEEYKYLRVWGVFILIDAIVLILSKLFFNTFITGIHYYYLQGPSFFFRTGLRFIQYFILLILFVIIGKTKKRTRVKLGKIDVTPHWAFFCILIGIKVFSTILEMIEMADPFSLFQHYHLHYFLISYPLILSMTMTLYYIFMKKMILKHNFKEIKITIFFLIGWIGIIIIMVFILQIDEYFEWNEIAISMLYVGGGTSIDIPIFVSIVNFLLTLIFFICEVILGIIAFKKSKELLGGENSEIS
jgi:hypothetical protein